MQLLTDVLLEKGNASVSGSSNNRPVVAESPEKCRNDPDILSPKSRPFVSNPLRASADRSRPCGQTEEACVQQVGPPTFPVVLSGCQVDGQVNNEEGSPPPRHAGRPHTQIHAHTLLRAHKHHERG